MWKKPVGLGAKRTRTCDIFRRTERNEFAESPAKGKISFVPENSRSSLDACIIDPAAFTARIEAAAQKQGFRSERFGEVSGVPLLALTKRHRGPRPRIYLSAGIHGDEPAPPLALLELIERGVFDTRAGWFLCPLLNPAGFIRRR